MREALTRPGIPNHSLSEPGHILDLRVAVVVVKVWQIMADKDDLPCKWMCPSDSVRRDMGQKNETYRG